MSEMKVLMRLEFELAYFETAVQHFGNYIFIYSKPTPRQNSYRLQLPMYFRDSR